MCSILSLSESNKVIKDLIIANKPFFIARLGGAVSRLTYIKKEKISPKNFDHEINIDKQIYELNNLDGIYNVNKQNLSEYTDMHYEALKHSNCLACFVNWHDKKDILPCIQDTYVKRFNLTAIHSRVLEPFYCILNNEIPWSHKLSGKKVLIIHPFINSFKQQLSSNFQIFKDKKIFLDDQKFIFYKPYQTLAGNKTHTSWKETFEIMCNEIKDLDFDIALLGCGGYGLPLGDFIKSTLNKSAIYIGGGLQLLFGVMGGRWIHSPMWQDIIKKNGTKFIRPSVDERCNNLNLVEGGCYW